MTLVDLPTLNAGIPELSLGVCANLAEAASVCLDDQSHGMKTDLTVDGDYSLTAIVTRLLVTDLMKRSHNDEEKATENGACGIAILLMKQLTKYTVIDQSRKGTGFDYWLGNKDEDPFKNSARLEVSGIRKGSRSTLANRINIKMDQINKSNRNLPAYIVVVEFGAPISRIKRKEASS
jgi:hypothetical protein